jgi:hypothetical protein
MGWGSCKPIEQLRNWASATEGDFNVEDATTLVAEEW